MHLAVVVAILSRKARQAMVGAYADFDFFAGLAFIE
jgi:hypothetical protein